MFTILLPLVAAVLGATLFLIYRFYTSLRTIRGRRVRLHAPQSGNPPRPPTPPASPPPPSKLLVVLGSGGHTGEMLRLLQHGIPGTAHTIVYVTSATDNHSAKKAAIHHTDTPCLRSVTARFEVLPRAREVGEGFLSSLLSIVLSLAATIPLVLRERPDVVLCNGPGTSAVVAAVSFSARAVLKAKWGRVIYVESLARVKTMSVSGRIVYVFADRYLVQWKQLSDMWPLAEYYGRLC